MHADAFTGHRGSIEMTIYMIQTHARDQKSKHFCLCCTDLQVPHNKPLEHPFKLHPRQTLTLIEEIAHAVLKQVKK